MSKNKNEQQDFWMGKFGRDYVSRNSIKRLSKNSIALFSKIFFSKTPPKECLELGANIGANLVALKELFPEIKTYGVEINKFAFQHLAKTIGKKYCYNQSIENFNKNKKYDLVFTKGVLIHINPGNINKVYEKLFRMSKKYILIIEYFLSFV